LALRNQTDDKEITTHGINTPELIERPKSIKLASPKPIVKAPIIYDPDRVIVEVIRGDKRSRQEF
jgi:hypothetical protein